MKGVLTSILLLLLNKTISFAQGCVVCSSTAAALDSKGARGLNGGIIYLAFLPLAIMLTIGFIWWKANKKTI